LRQAGEAPKRTKPPRPSIVDPYLPFVKEILEEYPTIRASRLFEMVKQRGYPGGVDHFRVIVARHRPKKVVEAYQRLTTLMSEEAQVDWGHFGHITIGDAKRPLNAFVMVLSWSRMIFLCFFLNQKMGSFLTGHVRAFSFFGGIPRVCLYDNLKSAVIERKGNTIRFNETMLSFSSHYGYEVRPVAVRRGNEKGRVERAIRYIRDNFFTARKFSDVEDLNRQAIEWCQNTAGERKCPEDKSLTVSAAMKVERARLLALPDTVFPTEERVEVRIGKTPYARFDLNDYSVPHTHVRRTLTALASHNRVRFLEGQEVVAIHNRSWGRGQQIEDPSHIMGLANAKRHGKSRHNQGQLLKAIPALQEIFSAIAERGQSLSAATGVLSRLHNQYGLECLSEAVNGAIGSGTLHTDAIRHLIERQIEAEGKPPVIPVTLPDDPRLKDVVVVPHKLSSYDGLESGGEHG